MTPNARLRAARGNRHRHRLFTLGIGQPLGQRVDHQAEIAEQAAKRYVRHGRRLLRSLGPGLITGASDDDPSGIATYSQIGAQHGYALGWTIVFAYPLMTAIQEICARIGRVTGLGLAGNLVRHTARPVLYGVVALVLVANVINIGADVGAMGAAVRLVVGGGPEWAYVVAVGTLSAALQVTLPYERYVSYLKWLSLSLFAYVGTVLVVQVPWGEVIQGAFIPSLGSGPDAATSVVAVLGTTISPYLFFWQAQLEAQGKEAVADGRPLSEVPYRAPVDLWRIRADTLVGMAFSNVAALFVVTTTAATLHAHGVTDIQTSAQAAEALKPVAGPFASLIFSLGIIGTGLMGVPVLAASAAFAIGEVMGWPVGLAHTPAGAKAFYAVIGGLTAAGVLVVFSPLDPFKALYWSAVINGVLAPPVMAVTVLMGCRRAIMGDFVLPRGLAALGWLATLVMAAAVAVMVLGLLGAL